MCVYQCIYKCRWHGVQKGACKSSAHLSTASSCYVAQGGLKLNPTTLASQVLKLQVCMTKQSSNIWILTHFSSVTFQSGKFHTNHIIAPACSFIISPNFQICPCSFPSECGGDWWCWCNEMGTDRIATLRSTTSLCGWQCYFYLTEKVIQHWDRFLTPRKPLVINDWIGHARWSIIDTTD